MYWERALYSRTFDQKKFANMSRRPLLGQCDKKEMKLPSPLLLEWCKNDDKESYSPVWKLGTIAIEACKLLTKCNCRLRDNVNKYSGSCGW